MLFDVPTNVTLSDSEAILKAIRGDREMGSGSCSVIDEAFSDDELLDALCFKEVQQKDGSWKRVEVARTVRGAMRIAYQIHTHWEDRQAEALAEAF